MRLVEQVGLITPKELADLVDFDIVQSFRARTMTATGSGIDTWD